jgi:hypothetical protein
VVLSGPYVTRLSGTLGRLSKPIQWFSRVSGVVSLFRRACVIDIYLFHTISCRNIHYGCMCTGTCIVCMCVYTVVEVHINFCWGRGMIVSLGLEYISVAGHRYGS